MNFAKSLMLGGAALLVATAGAQAADLPLKAKAVEYVKVCSLYGAGFYYIPGTDTCIKLGGYIRAEYAFNAGGMTETPSWNGSSGQGNRLSNNTIYRSRADLNIDTRTATEYGVVRTYFDSVFTWTTGSDTVANGSLGVYFAFVQFAGFTFGKAVSAFSTPWHGGPGNITSNLLGGDDTSTGINQVSYTAEFGNGVSASISLEDQSGYRWAQGNSGANISVLNVTPGNGSQSSWLSGLGSYTGTSYSAGTSIPDIVGKIRVDQAWGLFQVSAAAHQIRAGYYNPTNETSGHPSDKWGYAVLAGLSLKNLPTGPGDSINLDATYADGAIRYVIGGTSPNYFAMFGNNADGVAYQSLALGTAVDGVFVNGGGIETTKAWGIRGAFNHNWNKNWATSIFGAYSSVDYGSTGGALYTAALFNRVGGAFTGNPNFSIAQIGTRTSWTPVKNLTFSGEVMWMHLDQNYTGQTGVAAPGGTKPAAVYQFKDQDTVVGAVRVQRTF